MSFKLNLCTNTTNPLGPLEIACQDFFNHANLKTWLSDWQLANNRVSPIQCRAIISNTRNLLQQVEDVEKAISSTLSLYFSNFTREEWLGTFLIPLKKRLNKIMNKASHNFTTASTPS